MTLTRKQIKALTDDECIGMALLHGATILDWWKLSGGSEAADLRWGCWKEDTSDGDDPWYKHAAPTMGEAARLYCERHNLLR